MITYVPVGELTDQQLHWIAESLLVQPEDIRLSALDIIQGLAEGTYCAFGWPTGIMVVSTENHRLQIDAWRGRLRDFVRVVPDLKRLAADWGCDTITTLVFDPRFRRAIEKVGASVESVTMILPAE